MLDQILRIFLKKFLIFQFPFGIGRFVKGKKDILKINDKEFIIYK